MTRSEDDGALQSAEQSLREVEERFQLLVESVKDYAIFMLDREGIVTSWNAGAERIKGYSAREIIGSHFSRFYTEDDKAAHKPERELVTAVAEGRFEDEGLRVRKDGSQFWANVIITPLRDPRDEVIGFAKVTRDLTDRRIAEQERLRLANMAAAREEAERALAWAMRLQALTGAIAAAATPDEIASVVVEEGTRALSAHVGVFIRPRSADQLLEVVAMHGLPDGLRDEWQTFPPTARVPSATAFRTRQAQWIETALEYEQFPDSPKPLPQATCALPLVLNNEVRGVIAFGFNELRTFAPFERVLMETFASQAAQAVDRAEGHARELEARATAERLQASLALLDEATAALGESLDHEVTLAKVTRLVVPRLADWCAITIQDDGQKVLRQVAVAHVDPEKVVWARELGAKYPPAPDAPSGVPNVLRTGRPELYPVITDEMLRASAVDEEHLRISLDLHLRSAMVVPLIAHGRTFGAMTFIWAESGHSYSPTDLELAEELAHRCAIAIDNTRLYAAEQTARQSADIANRAKDAFLAMVSHELRTPLNAIMGWAKMISSTRLDESKRARGIETIDRNAVAMAQLIEDLLDVSRIISGKMLLEVQSTDLGRVVEAANESVRPAADAKGIGLQARIETPDAVSLMGDPTRLQQIVWNLLSNAVKFTPRGGTIEIVVRRVADHLEICVTDNGRGIAPGFLPHVFEPFRQEDPSHTRSRGGLGLGLAITKQLVELHGGSIEAESEGEGRGATFRVSLPTTARSTSEPPAPSRRPRQIQLDNKFERPEVLRGVRVLVVDDEEDARDLLRLVLEECGCVVTTTSSVATAFEAFEKSIPDVLVSDIGMPLEDGYELIRRIRALPDSHGGTIPAAALTAFARSEDRVRALSAGFTAHLPKPVEPAELVAVVAAMVTARKA